MRAFAVGVFAWAMAGTAAAAPFCHISNAGIQSCYYYSLDQCWQYVQSYGGTCAINQEEQQTQQRRQYLEQQDPEEQYPQASGPPFCHVTDRGYRNCWYYSLDACRNTVAREGGVCVYNR